MQFQRRAGELRAAGEEAGELLTSGVERIIAEELAEPLAQQASREQARLQAELRAHAYGLSPGSERERAAELEALHRGDRPG